MAATRKQWQASPCLHPGSEWVVRHLSGETGGGDGKACKLGWLLGEQSSASLLSCMACRNDLLACGGRDYWRQEMEFVRASIPGGISVVGAYFVFASEEDDKSREAHVKAFFQEACNLSALEDFFLCDEQASLVVALSWGRRPEERVTSEEQALFSFYSLSLLSLEFTALSVVSKPNLRESFWNQHLLLRARFTQRFHFTPDKKALITALEEVQQRLHSQNTFLQFKKASSTDSPQSMLIFPIGLQNIASFQTCEDFVYGHKNTKKQKKMHQTLSNYLTPSALEFQILESFSSNAMNTQSPILQFTPNTDNNIHILYLSLDALVYASLKQQLNEALLLIIEKLYQQLKFFTSLVPSFNMKLNTIKFSALHFQPYDLPHLITLIYPMENSTSFTEDHLMDLRQSLHQTFLLPMDRPLLRTVNALTLILTENTQARLCNVHKVLGESGVQGGTMHLIHGSYEYYHYMQDYFDDKGWGCAYRSMQTICSWFNLQGYIPGPIPNHQQIQKLLVHIGDKPSSFVDSKQWIGAIEIMACLKELYGITCKILNVTSGSELKYKASELAYHFDTEGTPVMIGGGVLAYTLLGIDYNAITGAIKFLILDPHYTGPEDIKAIKDKWCGWRDINLFRKDSFYNLCLPLRPKEI
ncbi:Ufm1-specific protease 2 [Balamuthia mandrillaris]